jgi:hypothetical protein
MTRYRFTGERDFYHLGECLDKGDEIELSEYAYRLHDAYFEPVGDSDADVSGDEGASDGDQAETCDVVKESDGEVCGRDLPCPYHSDDGDE